MDRHGQMQAFLAVSQTLSLAAAARQLGLSAPTVTRAVEALEQRLGLALLQRSTQGVTLTEAGQRFAADCERLLQQVREAEASAAGLHLEPRGRLTVSMPLLLGQQVLTPMLLDYLQRFPDVDVVVRYLERLPNLHEEGLDVAIVAGNLPDSSLVALPVGQVRRVVCASPGYLARHGEPQAPADLARHRIIHALADSRLPEWRFRVDGELRPYPLRPRLACATTQGAIQAACLGGGLTRCLGYQAHEQLANGQLRTVLAPFAPPPVPLHVVYREGRRAAARVRSFVDLAVAGLRNHGALNGTGDD